MHSQEVAPAAAPHKHCEICGECSAECRYVFVAQTRTIVFLESPHVRSVDRHTHIITLASDEEIEYDVLKGDLAFRIKPQLLPHIVCSNSCADDLTKQHFTWLPTLLEKTATLDCASTNPPIWDLLVFEVSSLRHVTSTCTECGTGFPNIKKGFACYPILKTAVVDGVRGETRMPDGFGFAQSNTTEERPKGRFWFYRIPEKSDKSKCFCSNECVWNYACAHDSLVMYPNYVERASFTIVTPYTKQINAARGEAYPFRPDRAMPLP